MNKHLLNVKSLQSEVQYHQRKRNRDLLNGSSIYESYYFSITNIATVY